MKNFLLCLLSPFCFLANAQKYQPIDSTIIWSTEEVGKNLASCYVQTECKYYLKGYVLNNSRIWNKVYKSYSSSGISFPACTTFVSGPPVLNSLFGYIWDDTLNKKVYFKYGLPASYTPVSNDIVYDFNNKNIGDTIYSFPAMPLNYRFGINSIDSVLFSGKYHKRYLTTIVPSHIFLTGKQITFTEGIGSSLGALTYTINAMGEAWSYLLCFATPTQTMSITNHSVYTSGGPCSNIVLGITKEKEAAFTTVYPNPANEFIFIQNTNSNESEYQIFNSIGQTAIEGSCKNTTKIRTEGLASGIYFIRINKSETKKFLIQKE